jgi:hypothetical protein
LLCTYLIHIPILDTHNTGMIEVFINVCRSTISIFTLNVTKYRRECMRSSDYMHDLEDRNTLLYVLFICEHLRDIKWILKRKNRYKELNNKITFIGLCCTTVAANICYPPGSALHLFNNNITVVLQFSHQLHAIRGFKTEAHQKAMKACLE